MPKHFSIHNHSDVYEPIWFTVGMMIDTIELYILDRLVGLVVKASA